MSLTYEDLSLSKKVKHFEYKTNKSSLALVQINFCIRCNTFPMGDATTSGAVSFFYCYYGLVCCMLNMWEAFVCYQVYHLIDSNGVS